MCTTVDHNVSMIGFLTLEGIVKYVRLYVGKTAKNMVINKVPVTLRIILAFHAHVVITAKNICQPHSNDLFTPCNTTRCNSLSISLSRFSIITVKGLCMIVCHHHHHNIILQPIQSTCLPIIKGNLILL